MYAQHNPKDNRSRTLLRRMALRVGPGGDIEGLSDKLSRMASSNRLGGATLHIRRAARMQNALYLRPECTYKAAVKTAC